MLGSRGWGNREWVKLATVGSWINLFQQRMKCKKWMSIIWVFQEIICMHIQRKKRMAGNCSKPKHSAVFCFWHNKTGDTLSYNFWHIWWLTRRCQLGLSLTFPPGTSIDFREPTCLKACKIDMSWRGWVWCCFFRVKMRPSFWSCKQLDCHNPCGNMSGISEWRCGLYHLSRQSYSYGAFLPWFLRSRGKDACSKDREERWKRAFLDRKKYQFPCSWNFKVAPGQLEYSGCSLSSDLGFWDTFQCFQPLHADKRVLLDGDSSPG